MTAVGMLSGRGSAIAGLAAALVAVAPATVAAHTHVYIDVSVEVNFDSNGLATGLKQVWRFDEFYTVFATDGLDRDGDGSPDQDQLDDLLRSNLKNLEEFNYFTQVRSVDADVPFKPVTEMSTRMVGPNLEMTFTVEFADVVAVNDEPLVYAIFDPTYYVDMTHTEDGHAVHLAGAPDGCGFDLIEPDPDPALVAFAASLDRTQSAGDTLGASFAEQVLVRCGSQP